MSLTEQVAIAATEKVQTPPTMSEKDELEIELSTSDSAKQKQEQKNPYYRLSNVGRAESIFNQAQNQLDDNGINNLLYDLADSLLMPGKKISGDADSFHNFSVTILKKADDYDTALEIVELGLKLHPSNTDLLADGISYGSNCGQAEKCERFFDCLRKIDYPLWTWRAFSFSIDYILDQSIFSGNTDNMAPVFELTKLYQQYYPQKEDSWFIEYQIYEKINQIDAGIAVLKKAITELSYCPKCWLRYADIMVDRGLNKEAVFCIKKLRSRPQSSKAVTMSYVYYLDGLCRANAILDSDTIREAEVEQAYKTLKLSLGHSSLRPDIERRVRDLITTLENETDIVFPY